MSVPVITQLRARAVVAPMQRPLRSASGSVPAAPLLLVDVATDADVVGRAYLFGYTPAALAPLAALAEQLAPDLVGRTVAPVSRARELQARFRLLGMQGLVGMLTSTIDMALWDALGKATGQPVATLLGAEPVPLRAYDSYGMVDPERDEENLRASMAAGFRGIKIKLGYPDVAEDLAVLRWVRNLIGSEVELMVDYNQSLDPPEAIRRIRMFDEFNLYWIEEPVPAEDLAGHAWVRQATGARIQTGENWWFPRGAQAAITEGASDFVMLDVMKIGGVTGWLSAAGQAEGASLPVSSHLFVETSAHLLPATPTADWLEHLDLAGAVLREPYRPVDGCVTAVGPGLGIEWDEDAVGRYLV